MATIRDRIRELRRVPARDLLPHARNWRRHPPAQRAALEGILREVGWADAVLAYETDDGLRLIDGHLRSEVDPDAEIPVLVLDVDDDEAAKILATHDPLAAMAATDDAVLRDLLAGIEVESAALQEMLDGLAPAAPADGCTPPDEAPAPPDEPETRPGDLWLLGDHRLLCGDATSLDDVRRLMDGGHAALVATDPPYLVDYTGERPNDAGKDWSDRYREIDIRDAEAFFRAVFANVVEVAGPQAAIYCWHAHKRTGVIQAVWESLGIVDHQQVVWVKPTPVFGRVFWHFRHEPCMMGWVKRRKPKHDGNHEHDSVWIVDWEGKARVVGNEHPTQKPVELFERPMRKHTQRGDVCFEPFCGSGSQLVAAERLERRCFALELEPRFVDVAVRRWEEFTGGRAERCPARESSPPS